MIDAERIREAARDVLGRPAYDELQQSATERLLDRVRTAVADLLDAIFGSGAAGGIGLVIAWVVVVLVVVGALVVLLGLRRRVEVEQVVDLAAGRDATGLLADADQARARGDLDAAVRARYGALVLVLVEAGVLAGRPGLTVGEVDQATRDAVPTAAGAVAAAGRVLADTVYGGRPADEEGDLTVARGLTAVARATGRRDLRPDRVPSGSTT